jgi:hypothetical protein
VPVPHEIRNGRRGRPFDKLRAGSAVHKFIFQHPAFLRPGVRVLGLRPISHKQMGRKNLPQRHRDTENSEKKKPLPLMTTDNTDRNSRGRATEH